MEANKLDAKEKKDRTEYMKKYREAHKDKCKEYRRKWRQAHKDDETLKAKNAIYSKTYYQKQKIMKTYYSHLKEQFQDSESN